MSWRRSYNTSPDDPQLVWTLQMQEKQRRRHDRAAKNMERIKRQRAARKKMKEEHKQMEHAEHIRLARFGGAGAIALSSAQSVASDGSNQEPAARTSRSGKKSNQSYGELFKKPDPNSWAERTKPKPRRASQQDIMEAKIAEEIAVRFGGAPAWKLRVQAQTQKAAEDRQLMLDEELANVPAHMQRIIDNSPNYPWNNYPYRADPKLGFALWPLQGMQGSKTPVRGAPYATASREREWKSWKTTGKDDLFDPKRDGRSAPAESMKAFCSPWGGGWEEVERKEKERKEAEQKAREDRAAALAAAEEGL